ncbi:MAG TPA: hypothetical protein VMU92_00895 [Acidobacteriaceae bacterium]|nr:hypothetical protein [Acidobacteriaceae bacterium]
MHLSSIDDIFWALGNTGELLLLAILILRGRYKIFPLFTAYIVWLAISDPLLMAALASHHDHGGRLYYRTYFVFNIIQYILELSVLFEIASVIMRPVVKMMSKNVLFILAIVLTVIVAGAFLLTADLNSATLSHPRTYFVVNTTMAILRLTIFVLIAGFSQLLGLTWKNHVLQLTSGLAFYSVVALIVELAHSHLRASPSYHSTYIVLDHLRIGGYLCALYFWCYAFARNEAPRKEFSPQMAKFLVLISGSTKRQRAVLARTRDQ